MRRLFCWMEDRPVGWFDETDEGIVFRYEENATSPISLSLPRNGAWVRKAPARFLENLLPDDPDTREVMKRSTGAGGVDTFSLLDGADASGGLVFSLREDNPRDLDMGVVLADDDSIALRIATMRNSDRMWWQSDERVRFSLAGNQPKFSLMRLGDLWAWSNAANPSTHIVKPAPSGRPGDRLRGMRDADIIEAASMKLAGLCGLDVTESGVVSFVGEPAYITRRFDRYERGDGSIGRIHTEDMMQALGLPPKSKYGVKAKDVLRVLHRADPSNALSYQWIRQLALNVSVSNADAHAKNYSLMLRPEGISLTPMYDVLTTTYWPKVDRTLPMSIGGARGAKQITPHHWKRLAEDNNGLDEEKVVSIARNIAWQVLANAPKAYEGLPDGVRDALLEELDKANRGIEPREPSSTIIADASAGDVYVHPHVRNGRPVGGYWRSRPHR